MRRGCAGYARRTPLLRERLEPRVVLHERGNRVRRRLTRPQHIVIGYGSLVDHGARRYSVSQVAHDVGAVLVHNRIHFYQGVGASIAQLQRRPPGPRTHTHKAHREGLPLVFARLHAYRAPEGVTAVQRQGAGAHSPMAVHHGGFDSAPRKRRQKSDIEKGYDRHDTSHLLPCCLRRPSRTATRLRTSFSTITLCMYSAP